SITVESRIEITTGHKKPITDLSLQTNGVLPLNMAKIFARADDALRRGKNQWIFYAIPLSLQSEELDARVLLQMPVVKVVNEIKLYDVRAFVNSLGRREDVPREDSSPAHVTPCQRGFVPVLELIFVAQHHLRPIGQVQPEINPRPP